MSAHWLPSSRRVEPRVSWIRETLISVSLLVLPIAGCISGVDTVRITTDPPGADLYCVYREAETDPVLILRDGGWRDLRSYAGKTPMNVAALWCVHTPFPYVRGIGGQIPFQVILEKAGYPVITETIPSRGRHRVTVQWESQDAEEMFCNRDHLVSVRRGSRFGWGSTYEYFFKLDDYKKEEELVDFRQACRLLKVSPMVALPWFNEGRFPEPVTPPRDERSAFGALWRRMDIEAFNRERQVSPEGSDE